MPRDVGSRQWTLGHASGAGLTRQKGQPPGRAQAFRAPGKTLLAHPVLSVAGQGGQGMGILSGLALISGFQDPDTVLT